jgi:hypothetical protein
MRIRLGVDAHVDVTFGLRPRFFFERLSTYVWGAGFGPLSLFIVLPERSKGDWCA